MSFCISPPVVSSSFDLIRRSFLQNPDLPLSDVLTEAMIEHAFQAEGVSFGVSGERRIWTMATTIWAMISQGLFTGTGRSCRAAVMRIAAYFAILGERVSTNTGNYCRARAQVGEAVVRRLAKEVAERSQAAVPRHWKWLGMTVKLADGTDISMPDTPANQEVYPQPVSQAKGLGFPLMRAVALISLETGMVTDLAVGPYAGKETGETALLRLLFQGLKPGEVVLADRYYCGWFMLALLRRMGVHFVVRMHHLRKFDFSLGRRLGNKDHVVRWLKPDRPDWMDQETYDQLPDDLEVRETHVPVCIPGFRTKSIVVVSSFLTPRTVRHGDLADLYRQRWRAELHLREIKSTMELDILRAQSPRMARQELWTGILTYNLIRHSLMQSALAAETLPSQLSFAAATQLLSSSWMLASLPPGTSISTEVLIQLRIISGGAHCVGDRPDRIEPRAVKRRPKPHALLTITRQEAIAKLLAGPSA